MFWPLAGYFLAGDLIGVHLVGHSSDVIGVEPVENSPGLIGPRSEVHSVRCKGTIVGHPSDCGTFRDNRLELSRLGLLGLGIGLGIGLGFGLACLVLVFLVLVLVLVRVCIYIY